MHLDAMRDAQNLLIVQVDGPLMVTGDLVVVTPTGGRKMQSAMLCRCGRSADKPFCDGQHVKTGFADSARLPADVESGIAPAGTLTITPRPNGPLQCDGPLTLRGAEQRTTATGACRLCRCGGSQRKPYCDGTHARIGFAG